MKPILEVKNLTVQFKDESDRRNLRRKPGTKENLAAVHAVSFSLYPNEVLGIVGESGSGKSTVARAITRLIPAKEGSICLDGKDITAVRGKERRQIYEKIQMVFQSPAGSFDPGRTLGYSVGESLQNSGLSKQQVGERVKELLVRCGLPEEFADRYPHTVSGGQCQRAAIARALVVQPEVLICDEATSALDVTVQKQILHLLAELKEREKMSYLFICHDLALVQDFSDRVLVMRGGRIVEEGTPEDILQHPRSSYTEDLIRAALL